jgi:hypothetical protein
MGHKTLLPKNLKEATTHKNNKRTHVLTLVAMVTISS